ncbi:ABC transporter substrate-binding protein [Moorella sp. Hama-1]|uniref:ABC transporter substrate-binding protein n=1 Tax=Moorella sp. Hama-1 TaxID=2138101 RepID=UPI000D64473A|nr:sugar ABC transporter substrate-binding protein [Moorella sp. Hama-1]BCV22271.1 ABC transporter substrate-binding protein [Moorella sp. Hama-1]
MSRKKWIVLSALLTIFTLTLTACGGGNSSQAKNGGNDSREKVEITFVNWATAEEATKNQVLEVIKAFETENPNIKVKNIPIPFTEIQNQLTIMTTGGNAPDVAQLPDDVGISLAAMGALEPVDNLLSKEFAADVNKAYYNIGIYKNQHFLVPWIGGPNGFWYNKKLMQEVGLDPNKPPRTIEELDAAMAQIKAKKKDVVPLQYDTTVRPFALTFQWPFMQAFGTVPFSADKVEINGMTAYAQWLRDLVSKGYTLPGKKLGEFRPLAAQNRLVFGIDAPFVKGIIQSFDKSITDQVFYETWGVTTLPTGPDGKSYTVGGSNHFTAVFKASKHKEAAIKFVEYLANSDVALQKYVIPVGFLPVTDSAVKRFPDAFNNPVAKAFIEKINPTIISPPYGPNYTKAGTIVSASMQEVITTTKPIDEILNSARSKLEGVLLGK